MDIGDKVTLKTAVRSLYVGKITQMCKDLSKDDKPKWIIVEKEEHIAEFYWRFGAWRNKEMFIQFTDDFEKEHEGDQNRMRKAYEKLGGEFVSEHNLTPITVIEGVTKKATNWHKRNLEFTS